MITRAYYYRTIHDFLTESESSILGELAKNNQFALEDLQRDSWIQQIRILKDVLNRFQSGYIGFEFSIPRMGKRADVIIIHQGILYVLEFKVGERGYSASAIQQVQDYALDLKNFHEGSHHILIAPVLIATEAQGSANSLELQHDEILNPVLCNKDTLKLALGSIAQRYSGRTLDSNVWYASGYKPTPTIIEAAQALYQGHDVTEISRSDSGAINLSETSNAISRVIDQAKAENRKAICFVTGVPGAGKTLAGLNIANERHNVDEGEHAVFLSGNGPLVNVLQEALARNEKEHTGVTKDAALSRTKAFIQNIHHFRDDAIQDANAPVEHVAIFDEAQRAWTKEQTTSFMSRKKGIRNFNMSEPEFLISVMDRHQDWAVIVCLIGGGQEINTGEAGLQAWFSAIGTRYRHWDVYVSNRLTDTEYTNGEDIYSLIEDSPINLNESLHLGVSVRSYRSENVAAFVKSLLDVDIESARRLHQLVAPTYPIYLTRDIDTAKDWLRSKCRGSERMGLVCSSGAYRLKPYGLHVKSNIDPKIWFLNEHDDVRSSNFLEDAATEFDIQGLELDWVCLAWDADLRFDGARWEYKDFKGCKWNNVNDATRRRYLLNAYRVLLTRARQGLVIFIPEGSEADNTRAPAFYDPLYEYLKGLGITEI